MRYAIYSIVTIFLGTVCAGFFATHVYANDPCNTTAISGKSESELRADLAKCEEEIKKNQAVLDKTTSEAATIDAEVQTLGSRIKYAERVISQKQETIQDISTEIIAHIDKIAALEADLERGKSSLAELIRQTNEIDDYTFAEVFLNNTDLSEFYIDIDDYIGVKRDMEEHFQFIRSVQKETEHERDILEQKRTDEQDAQYEVQQQRKQVASDQAEKKVLLAAKEQEASVYKGIIAERQAKAAAIRAELFRLRDATAISFEDAVMYAKQAESRTGVRAAFILAILRQESNLGKNVGQCLLVDPATGAGKGKNTGTYFAKVMSPTRDVPVFLSIMKNIGRDPYNTPVSCPLSIGWGGAMGPTQFIPSTWNGVAAQVASLVGVGTADPWNPQHAVMATGVFTQQLGAAARTYSAEREAAARYYAGGNWATYGLGYAASVLNYAEQYQDSIDFLDSI